ncbi:uncharacterized protein C10orf143 homolog isoform X1 [Pleurodeles waltl]
MSVQMDFTCSQKRRLVEETGGHSNHKRVCKGVESVQRGKGGLFQPLKECLLGYWDMQLSPSQENSEQDNFLRNVMEQHSSVILQNHESSGSVQPCLRCIAGESKLEQGLFQEARRILHQYKMLQDQEHVLKGFPKHSVKNPAAVEEEDVIQRGCGTGVDP